MLTETYEFQLSIVKDDGSTVYSAPHELGNVVQVTFPPGYWTGSQPTPNRMMELPKLIGIAMDLEFISPNQKVIHADDTTEYRAEPDLPEELVHRLRRKVAEDIYDGQFGDGMEEDYAWDGVTITGANEMSVLELIDYAEQFWADGIQEDDFEFPELIPYFKTNVK